MKILFQGDSITDGDRNRDAVLPKIVQKTKYSKNYR